MTCSVLEAAAQDLVLTKNKELMKEAEDLLQILRQKSN